MARVYRSRPAGGTWKRRSPGTPAPLPGKTTDFILRPVYDLRDRLTLAQPGEHLVVDAAVEDLHSDLGRGLRSCQCRFLSAAGAHRVVKDSTLRRSNLFPHLEVGQL